MGFRIRVFRICALGLRLECRKLDTQHLSLVQTKIVEADIWMAGWPGIQDSPGSDYNIPTIEVASSHDSSRCRSYCSHNDHRVSM